MGAAGEIGRSLSPARREYLLSLLLQQRRGRRAHAWHPEAEDVLFVGSATAKAVLGLYYRNTLRTYLSPVSEDYSAREGVARAYRWRPEVVEEVESWAGSVEPRRAGPGEEEHCAVLRGSALRRRAEQGDLQCAVLLARSEPVSGDLVRVREVYRRATPRGRRFVVGVGVQHLPRAVRREVCVGLNYVEVDAVNCLPTILDQLAGGRLPGLHRYATRREEVLSEIRAWAGCTRQAAKSLMLMITGGAALKGRSLRAWAGREGGDPLVESLLGEGVPGGVREYARDVDTLSRWCAEASGEDVEGRSRWRRLSLAAQRAEDEVLRACQEYHRRRGEEVGVLVFDGYLVRGLEGVDHVDLDALSRFVERRTGWRVIFAEQPLDGRISRPQTRRTA